MPNITNIGATGQVARSLTSRPWELVEGACKLARTFGYEKKSQQLTILEIARTRKALGDGEVRQA